MQAAPKAGLGVVYIGRPMTMRTSVFAVPIELDGNALTSLGPSQYLQLELPPGKHTVAISNTVWGRMTAGIPHPAEINVEAGKAYYLLPTNWAGERQLHFTMINGMAIPEQTAANHMTFAVQANAANAPPPAEFLGLTRAEVQ